MADAAAVDILDAADDLLKELACLSLLQLLAFNYVIEQFSATGILHDQKELPGGLNDLCTSKRFRPFLINLTMEELNLLRKVE